MTKSPSGDPGAGTNPEREYSCSLISEKVSSSRCFPEQVSGGELRLIDAGCFDDFHWESPVGPANRPRLGVVVEAVFEIAEVVVGIAGVTARRGSGRCSSPATPLRLVLEVVEVHGHAAVVA